ncbi:hypothetical protein ACJIZ3_001734 [Penstemon smallii]|uniref:RING-type E3 ubiquitin transferase n=1 Tax=Penstemon smallii TaxID=265156 RepID=A0ABD3U5W3_9LAMI
MEGYSGKRGASGLMAPRKGHTIPFKDSATERDQNSQFCNRIGCSGRIKYTQNPKIGSTSDKGKCSQPSFHSSNGNKIIMNPSRNSPITTSAKKSYIDSKRKSSSQLELDPSESSRTLSSESKIQSESMKKSGKFTVTEVGSSSVSSNIGPRKIYHPKSESYNQNTPPASISKCSSMGPFSSSNGSRSESKSLGKEVMKQKVTQGESSLSRLGRKTSNGISISDSRPRSSASGEDSSSAVRTRRSMNLNTRWRLSYRQNGRNSLSVRENGLSQIFGNEITANVSSSGSSSFSFSTSNGDNSSATLPFNSSEFGFTRFMNHESLTRYNMDGFAEVLLALQRIEQNEELTREQVLALETSLFLSGLNLYDQHRDMRLDIDSMSYEELLALEEKMGTVSTAISEDALTKCLSRSMYEGNRRVTGSSDDGDDIKCTICQEEYVTGDEIGELKECEHGFHESCIIQWLRLKNWCPICKASASSTS